MQPPASQHRLIVKNGHAGVSIAIIEIEVTRATDRRTAVQSLKHRQPHRTNYEKQ